MSTAALEEAEGDGRAARILRGQRRPPTIECNRCSSPSNRSLAGIPIASCAELAGRSTNWPFVTFDREQPACESV